MRRTAPKRVEAAASSGIALISPAAIASSSGRPEEHELAAAGPGAGHRPPAASMRMIRAKPASAARPSSSVDAGGDLFDGRVDRRRRCCSRPSWSVVVGHVDDLGEQLLLAVGEVVVERAPGHAGLVEDLADRRGLVALLDEQPQGGVDQERRGTAPPAPSGVVTGASVHRPGRAVAGETPLTDRRSVNRVASRGRRRSGADGRSGRLAAAGRASGVALLRLLRRGAGPGPVGARRRRCCWPRCCPPRPRSPSPGWSAGSSTPRPTGGDARRRSPGRWRWWPCC